MGSGDIRAGRAFVEVGVADKTAKVLNQIGARFKAIGSMISDAGTKMSIAGAAIVAPLLAAAKSSATSGAAIYDMAQRTGISTDALQKLGFAAEMSGSSLEALEPIIRRMQKSIAGVVDPAEGTTGSLRELGLTAEDLKDQSPDQQLGIIAQRLQRIKDPSLQAAEAMKIFGRSGTEILPMINHLADMEDVAQQLGLVRSPEAIKDAKTLSMLWKILLDVGQSLSDTVAEALTPALKACGAIIIEAATKARDWIKSHQQLIATAFKVGVGLLAAGAAFLVLGKAVSFVGSMFSGMATLVKTCISPIFTLFSALFTWPGLVVAALAIGIYAFLRYTSYGGKALAWLEDRFSDLEAWVGSVMDGITDALTAGDISLAGQILWAALKVAWATGVSELSVLMDGLQTSWENIIDGMTQAWIEGIAMMQKAFLTFKSWYATAVGETSKFFARAMVREQYAWEIHESGGKFDQKELDRRLADADKISDQTNQKDQDEIDAQKKKLQSDTAAALAGAHQIHKSKQDAIDDGLKKSIKAAQDEEDRLKGLEGKAKGEKKDGPMSHAPPSIKNAIKSLNDLIKSFEKGNDQPFGNVSSRGTFNGALAGMSLGGASSPQIRTAKATEATARSAKQTEMWTRQMAQGLSFS